MSTVTVPGDQQNPHALSGGHVQKLVNTTASAWHATFPSGGAVDETTPGAFTNPSSAEADRAPQLALGAGGTPGDYTITGTFDGVEVTEEITTVANDTVKGNQPFDVLTSITGPDPGDDLDLQWGDVIATPPARALWTGATGGAAAVQLEGESATKAIPGLPAGVDWPRRIVRVDIDNHGMTDSYLVW